MKLKDKPIEERFQARRKLMTPFIKKYGTPVIVHSTYSLKIFQKILNEGKLKLPKNHSSSKMTPYMERLLGIDNTIYYSLGFVYATAYDFRFNFIFNLSLLKECNYYENSIGYKCYQQIAKYWFSHDLTYLMKLRNYNKKTKEVIDKFLNEPYRGRKRSLLDFWKIEKILFNFILKYPRKDKLIKIVKNVEKELKVKYPYSTRKAREDYKRDKAIEVLGLKDNNLLKNPSFLGFYIMGTIPGTIMRKLKKDYPDKILFDGKKIMLIGKLK